MQKLLMILAIFLSSVIVNGQNRHIAITEPAIGLSHNELKLFLKGLLDGREPKTANDIQKLTYTLDNSIIHAEYSIHRDSCLEIGIRFKNEDEFRKAADEVIFNCQVIPNTESLYYKITRTGRVVIYSITSDVKIITLQDQNFILKP